MFDKFCERKAIHEDYFYGEVTYDYELLEDYKDLYVEFESKSESASRPGKQQQHPAREGGGKTRKVSTERVSHKWGPEHYKYYTHPLHLMVSYTG